MVGEALDMFTQPVRVQPLDRSHDLGVELAAPVPEQAPISHLVGEGVFESVLQVRKQLRLVEELRFLQTPLPQGLRWLPRDRREERVRHILSDHGGRLQELLLLLREPVGIWRGQDRLHRGRDLQRFDRVLADKLHADRRALPSPRGCAPSPPGRTDSRA